jgi:hypothetical protein
MITNFYSLQLLNIITKIFYLTTTISNDARIEPVTLFSPESHSHLAQETISDRTRTHDLSLTMSRNYHAQIARLTLRFMTQLSFHERSERAKRANVVSGMVENLCRKKFSPARIGVGGCRLSVRPSVRLSVRPSVCLSTLLCWITFEPVELSWWNFGSLPNSLQVIFWHYFGNPRTLGLGPRASGGSNFQTYLLPGFWS